MNRNLKRTVFAFAASASCFMGTVIWFNSEKRAAHTSDRPPIARLNESLNDVQRKPLQRVIWESVSKNDNLYAGEAIRTSAGSEAKILFVKSGTVIHLEPESLVVLEENAKGLVLDFLEGNMYVQSTEGDKASDLTLKAGSGEIKLQSADLSLSREKSGEVNMAVHKGQAELQQGSQKIALDKESSATMGASGLRVDKDRVQILWPTAGEPVLLNLAKGEKLAVAFKPLPAGYKVAAEWGATRSNLRPLEISATGESGKLPVSGKAGKWFIRLSATSDNPAQPPMTSAVLAIHIDPKAAPTPIEPTAAEPIVNENSAVPVLFRWLNRHAYESQVIEVASDAKFKDVKLKKVFNDDTMEFSEALGEGKFFWRVTGFLKTKDKKEALTSEIVAFTVQSQWNMKAPTLVAPDNEQRLSYLDVEKGGVALRWEAPAGVRRFKVTLQQKENNAWKTMAEKELDATVIKMAGLKPGTYQWQIASVDPKTNASKASNYSSFTVAELPRVEWVETSGTYEYTSQGPSLRAAWKPYGENMKYRYRVDRSGTSAKADWKAASEEFFETTLPVDGEYSAVVEAVDENGVTVAQSTAKNFNVRRTSLLPAPRWAPNTPEIFKTDAKGNLNFAWEKVEGAEHYLLTLENESGEVVKSEEVQRTMASVNRLKPGEYKVHLKSVDALKRPGPANSKGLSVPNNSDISAPTIKRMKVK